LQASFTVPATSDTTNFSFDGIGAVGTPATTSSILVGYSSNSVVPNMYASAGSGRVLSDKTNANMSGATVYISGTYVSS